MLPARRLIGFLFFACSFAFVAPGARAAAAPTHVQASLVAADASVQPGHALTVALHFVHEPRWHTYWLQPGTGLPTTIAWKLPPGWSAGGIQWPAPHLLKDSHGNIVGNGYTGDLLLPVTLTPPADLAPGTNVTLAADVDWLMCEDVCVPGGAKLALTLPVSAEAPKPDAAWGEKIRATIAALPRAEAAWKIAAGHDAKNVTLTVTPAQAASFVPADLHFFSADSYVEFDAPQQVKPDGHGGFTLTLPISPEADKAAKKLVGVLTSETGWQSGGALRGLQVDADFSTIATTMAEPLGAGTVALAFVGGLILNLMPCVFPVLGLKILGFVHQAGQARAKVVAHGLVFTLGVLLSFWTLAGVLAVLRGSGHELGWGFQLQEPAFVFALAALLLVFAMNMSGVFEFGLGATAVGSELQMKSGLAGSFFTGVLATVVATPCSAPILAPALGAALAVPTAESFLLFTAIGLGLSLPYLLLSVFPAAVKILPRPGAWMETFKQFMAFPLYATVGVLVWVLSGQVPDETLLAIMGLVVIAVGVWVYGRWHAPGASTARARFGSVALAALLVGGAWIGWPHASKIAWEPWSPEAVAKLRADGRIVYVDFTAKWCFTCQTNKTVVFHSDAVLKYFADHHIATLRGDWTNRDPRITNELAAYNRSAVPFNLIWLPGKDQPVILPELLTPGTVLDALKKS
ncbi:MAG TPA: protein-disulfide reductase DsbD domain-containing protein [Opitutaceae bacterium]|nr:protein-disulfide reductase DsbD domain-containing protein [Opitutaceae bacterium]